MPPFVPRKRHHSPSQSASTPPPREQRSRRGRPTVFEALDDEPKVARTPDEHKAFLDTLAANDDKSSSSDLSSGEFEDVLPAPAAKRRRTDNSKSKEHAVHEEESSDEEMEWEDAVTSNLTNHLEPLRDGYNAPSSEMAGLQDLEITIQKHDAPLYDPAAAQAAVGKKGPSKIERNIRNQTHMIHVQILVWHNAVRNTWINDEEVQKTLLNGISDGVKAEVRKYRSTMGIPEPKDPGQIGGKGKGKAKDSSKEASARENNRDWGVDAGKLENESPNLSRGDPLIRLLKYLSAYWRKRFRITASALRKQGYLSPRELDAEIKSFQNDPHDPALHGERIASLTEFRELAKKYEGSRDVGAQLFTALLRALQIESRMVVSLQPVGFGWTKQEEGKARQKPEIQTKTPARVRGGVGIVSADKEVIAEKPNVSEGLSRSPVRMGRTRTRPMTAHSDRPKRGTTSAPISLHDTSSELSDPPSTNSDTEASIIDITSTLPLARNTASRIDEDLTFPTYWTEVFSPASNLWIPVSVLVSPIIATQPEHLSVFEPKGAAAEKSRQVICYVIAYSADRTAKDVTVRYLKKHIWPGKTKQFRMPPARVSIYNRHGKILRHEEYDWFKRVLSPFERLTIARTAADDIEDQGDLVAVQPDRKSKDGQDGGTETLQGYKTSAEFVLERFLRREEALAPGAQAVRHFHTKAKGEERDEPVYRRADVLACKTVETWHREGRQVKAGEPPLKRVPFRAVTLVRRREVEEAARQSGETPLQGLYAEHQTEWIVPDPIGPDGVIPKNTFGNIDVYVPSMVPRGAVHIPLRGTAKLCKKLGIEFAEACTGFEFGKQRAVPVLTGVVVANEHKDAVIDAWKEGQERQRVKDESKREALVLGLWKKFYVGMVIRERVRREYHEEELGGEADDEATGNRLTEEQGFIPSGDPDVAAGGFFLPGHGDDEVAGGGFLLESEDEEEEHPSELVIENHGSGLEENSKTHQQHPDTPISLQSRDTVPDKVESSSELSELESEDDYIPAQSTARGHGSSVRAKTRKANAATRRSAATKSPYFKQA